MDIEIVRKLLAKIEEIQSILIAVATGKDIKEVENYYKELYRDIELHIEILNDEGLNILNPNIFKSLWEWNGHYRRQDMNSYKRQTYVYDIYSTLIETLQDLIYLDSNPNVLNYHIEKLDIFDLQKLLNDIAEVKGILDDTATVKSKIEDKYIEELYCSIYNNIELQIMKFWFAGLPIANPNRLRTIPHWKAYYLSKLEGWSSRRKFINTLYANIIDIISKSLKRQSIKNTSKEEFFHELKSYLSEQDKVVLSRSKHRFNNLLKNSKQSIVNDSLEETNTSPQKQSTSDEADIVILTALEKERDAILRYLESPQIIEYSGRTFYKSCIKTSKSETVYQVVIVCLSSMGNNQAAIATQKAITKFNPSHIILAGIAGGVPKENSRYLGDVIIGEQIVDCQLKKQVHTEQENSRIQRRYEVYRPAGVLLKAAKKLLPKNWVFCVKAQRPDGNTGRIIPNVHFGVVASDNTVIADQDLRDELQTHWSQLVGVEMEAAGAALAAYENDFLPGILLVKGMCDWADGSKNDDWQEYAAETAASFVVELLKSAPFESKFVSNTFKTKKSFISNTLIPEPLNKEEYTEVTKGNKMDFSGSTKRNVCKRLTSDWADLADELNIPTEKRATFQQGREPHAIWEWLEEREKLYELEDALIAIEREDLVEILNK